jgi:hypothetical protein
MKGKKLSYEKRQSIVEEYEGETSMYGSPKIMEREVGHKWVKVERDYDAELLECMTEWQSIGKVRNIKVGDEQ